VKQPDAFRKLLAGTPLKTVTRDRLDYISGGSIEEGSPRDTVALVAEGTAELPPADYTLTVISDDAVRVWMDGEVVLDAWSPHESRVGSRADPRRKAPVQGGILRGRRFRRAPFRDIEALIMDWFGSGIMIALRR
jgi:hypothetical protein